jgi:hypothetical protein
LGASRARRHGRDAPLAAGAMLNAGEHVRAFERWRGVALARHGLDLATGAQTDVRIARRPSGTQSLNEAKLAQDLV